MRIYQALIFKLTSSSKKGLTFLEILAVIFIISVLLSVTIPTFVRFSSTDLEKATQQLSALIDKLQFHAFIHNQTLLLEIDPEKLFYQVYYTGADRSDWLELTNFEKIPLVEGIKFYEIETIGKLNTREKEGIIIRANSFIEQFSITFENDNNQKAQFKMIDVMGRKKILSNDEIY